MNQIMVLKALGKNLPNKEVDTIFVGDKYQNLLLAQKLCPSLYTIDKDEVLLHNRKHIIEFNNKIINLHDPLWLASDLAENNLCLERFTIYIVNLLVIVKKHLVKKRDIILICDDDEQVLIYTRMLKNNGFKVVADINYLLISKKIASCIVNKCKSSIISIYRILLIKVLRVYYKTPVDLMQLKQTDIIFVNWVAKNSFENDSLLLNDRYLGDLGSQLKSMGFKISIIGKPIDFAQPFSQIIKQGILHSKSTLFIQDFLSIKYVIVSFVKSFAFVKYWSYSLNIDGVNYSALWRWFCFNDLIKARIPRALESYYASQIFFSKIKNKNITLLYPYENQPWEKLLCLSFRGIHPGQKVFAYQHFPFAKDYLTAFPNNAVSTNSIWPTILLSDKFFGDWLQEDGFYNYRLFGNFRYKLNEISLISKSTGTNIKNILCSCSIQFDDSMELVSKAIKILNGLKTATREYTQLIVNFHPLMSSDQILHIKGCLDETDVQILWSNLGADQLLENTDILLYNSNSICFNAASRGIPAIFISSDLQINLDRIPNVSLKAKNIEDGIEIVMRLLNEAEFYKECSEKFKSYFKSYYVEPNYLTIKNLLLDEVN